MTIHLDCKGLKCPMPIVRISVAARDVGPGESLVVEASDPAFRADVHAWARRTGFEVADFVDGPTQSATLIRRSAP